MYKPIYPPKAEYRCPSCDNPFLGNLPNQYRYRYGYKFYSFGTNYTDGSQSWPISSDNGGVVLPWIIKCPKCLKFFKLSDFKKDKDLFEGKDKNWWFKNRDSKKYSGFGSLLSGGGVYKSSFWREAIQKGLYFPKGIDFNTKEVDIRDLYLSLWRAYNREKTIPQEMYPEEIISEKDYVIFCKTLAQKIKLNSDDDKIIVAELYRNIGDFEKSVSILNSITDRYKFRDKINTIEKNAILGNKEFTLIEEYGEVSDNG